MNTRGKELSPRTANWYRQKVEGSLSSLKKLPVDRIDRATVRALHEKITRKSGAYGANGAMRVLKLLINDAARTYDLPPNPVTRGVRMNREKARDWAVGPDDMPLLWQRLGQMKDRARRACWLVMLLTMTSTVIYLTSLFPGNYVNEAKGIDNLTPLIFAPRTLMQPYRLHDWNLKPMVSKILNWVRPPLSNATAATFITRAHISASKL